MPPYTLDHRPGNSSNLPQIALDYYRHFAASVEAAPAFRSWHAHLGLACPCVDGGRRPEGLVITHQIDAARRLHNASLALGRERMTLLYWAAIVDDLPWNRFGLRPGLSTETATCRTVAAIVAWRYGGSEPIPPAPVTRLRIEPGGGDAQHGTDGPIPLPPPSRASLRWIAEPVNKNRQQHLSMIDEAPCGEEHEASSVPLSVAKGKADAARDMVDHYATRKLNTPGAVPAPARRGGTRGAHRHRSDVVS